MSKQVIMLQNLNNVMRIATMNTETYFSYNLLVPTSEHELLNQITYLIWKHNEQVGGE